MGTTPSWRFVLRMIGLLPERELSRWFGRVADIPIPTPLRPTVLGAFARTVGIDLGEVPRPLREYPSINAFFVRALPDGARQWPDSPEAVASPVDGIVGQFGRIVDGVALQAKGHEYSVGEMLADPDCEAGFEGGTFVTIYLSPRHYHRIHTPLAGRITTARYIPGDLYPVNEAAVLHVHGLFVRNERLVCDLESARGRVGIAAIGAYNVGRISAAFDPAWTGGRGGSVTNRRGAEPELHEYDPPVEVATGEQIMAFHLGSTVVLALEPGVELRPDLLPGTEVRVGEQLDCASAQVADGSATN